jgi:hypothetical protein
MNFLTDDSIFTPARLPRRPLCTDQLSDGCWREPAARALQRKYIQINPPLTALWLAFDVDRPAGGLAWQAANLPEPAWSCTTRKNGHGHLVYGLEMPVRGDDLSNKAVRYLEAIKEGFRARLGGDPGYAGLLTKNPRHPDWLVERGLQKLWTLGELAEYVQLPSTKLLAFRQNQELGGLGRNVDTFDRLRFWAYRAVEGYRSTGQQVWALAVNQKLEQLNDLNSPPLPQNELKHIARSVAAWVWSKYSGSGGRFNQLASDIGKLGGRPRTTTKSCQPWVLAGIDRSTWYRHRANERQA